MKLGFHNIIKTTSIKKTELILLQRCDKSFHLNSGEKKIWQVWKKDGNNLRAAVVVIVPSSNVNPNCTFLTLNLHLNKWTPGHKSTKTYIYKFQNQET